MLIAHPNHAPIPKLSSRNDAYTYHEHNLIMDPKNNLVLSILSLHSRIFIYYLKKGVLSVKRLGYFIFIFYDPKVICSSNQDSLKISSSICYSNMNSVVIFADK